MAKDGWVGVNGVSRHLIDGYVGVNGVARKIIAGWVGDANGKARLCYQKPILPSAYQQVEYIQGTGTQYINTGVYLNSTAIKAQINIALTTNSYSSGDAYAFGCYGGDSARFYILIKVSSDSAAGKVRLGLGKGYWTDTAKIDTNSHTWIIDMANLKAYKDGSSKTASTAYTRGTNTKSWIGILSGSTESGGRNIITKGKVYSAKIWISNVLKHDYYPCFRRTDNVIGLYDMVEKKFLTNAGTGTFGKGANIIKTL